MRNQVTVDIDWILFIYYSVSITRESLINRGPTAFPILIIITFMC